MDGEKSLRWRFIKNKHGITPLWVSLCGFAFELPQMCKVFEKPTLILGDDVTHPNAGDKSSPNIAVVLANCDWSSEIKICGKS